MAKQDDNLDPHQPGEGEGDGEEGHEEKGSEHEEEEEETEEESEGEGEGGGDLKKALRQERGKRKASAAKLRDVEAKLAKAQPLAAEYEGILPYLPDLLAGKGLPGQKEKQASARSAVELEVMETANDFNLRTENGELDLEAGARALARINAKASQAATSASAPARKASAETTAAQIREKAYRATGKDGKPYATKEMIDQVFGNIPAENLVQGDTAVTALILARGMGGPGEEVEEPLHTESVQRRKSGDEPMTTFETSMARIRGVSDKEWKRLSGLAGASLEEG